MRRVAVRGVPGAGKSTFARALGLRSGLPVIHLDAHYFDPSWKPRPAEEWRETAARLVAGDDWIMDGAFAMESAVNRADTIVVLQLLRFIWRYDAQGRPALEERLSRLRLDQRVVQLRTRQEIRDFLRSVETG